jgi:hypothetical protein
MTKNFPNGFYNWLETYYDLLQMIFLDTMDANSSNWNKVLADAYLNNGHYAFNELCSEWTDEFEEKYRDQEWDGEYMDELEKFYKSKTHDN